MAPFLFHSEFNGYLVSEKRFSEHTLLAYEKDVAQFYEFAGLRNKSNLLEVNSRLVRGWVVSLLDEEYSNTSVNRKLSSLRTYFKWLMKEGVIKKNPMQSVVGPKTSKRLPAFVQQKDLEYDRLVDLFDDSFEGVRDHLLFEMLYQTGIRSSELINLKDSAVHSDRIKVLGKRNKERIIPISKELSRMINNYRNERKSVPSLTDNFFVLSSGKNLYPKFVYRKINSYLGKATELKKKSPHVLRHTFATHMLNNGAGLEVLKELLGHANLAATQVYTHNSFSQLTHIYSQSHPRGQKN